MQHFYRRCKHCGKLYTYCTYGNEDGCSMDYCGECQTAINKALDAIPVKFVARYNEIKNKSTVKKLKKVFEEIKSKHSETDENGFFAMLLPMRAPMSNGVDFIEEYKYEFKSYRVEYNKEKTEYHIYQLEEYDLIDKRFTGNTWNNDTHEETYVECGVLKPISFPQHEEKPLDRPTAKLFYMDSTDVEE